MDLFGLAIDFSYRHTDIASPHPRLLLLQTQLLYQVLIRFLVLSSLYFTNTILKVDQVDVIVFSILMFRHTIHKRLLSNHVRRIQQAKMG